MGNEIVEKVKCCKCGKENTILVWRELDVQKKPWVKRQMLDWEFFYSTCPDCGAKTDFFYTTTYADQDDKVIMRTYVTPPPVPEKIPFPMPPPAVPSASRIAFRDVIGWHEMREKILIFSLGLNDFQVEFMKYELQIQYQFFNLEFAAVEGNNWVFRNRSVALPHQEYIVADTRDYRRQLDCFGADYLYLKTFLHVDIILMEKIVLKILSKGV